MKRAICIHSHRATISKWLGTLLLVAAFAVSSFAAEQQGPLKVGMELAYPPFEMTDTTGTRTLTYGYDSDDRLIVTTETAPDGSITAITDELATLRQAVQTLADTVRHHDAQLRRLARD